MFPLKQNKIKRKKASGSTWVGAWVGGLEPGRGHGSGSEVSQPSTAGLGDANAEAEISGPCSHRALLCSDKGRRPGVQGRKQGNTGQRGTKISVFFFSCRLQIIIFFFYFFFFPPHTQSARFLVLSGALNSSRGCKAGLVQGRDPRFAGADACKVTRSLPINYRVPP